MSLTLTSADFNSIRVLLTSTTKEISDDDFNTYGLVTLVNSYLSTIVPDYSTLSGTDASLFKSAAVYMTAALATQIIQLKRSRSYKLGDYEESNTRNVDFEQLRQWLLSMSKTYLNLVSVIATNLSRNVIFASAGKTQSGINYPSSINNWFARIQPQLITWFDRGGEFIQGEDI